MVDYSRPEINAIMSVFPESKIALCDVHRERAWERWIRRKENGVQDRTSLIELLRKMAKALTEGEFLEAVRCLEECDEWKQNKKLQVYLKETWFPVKEWWVNY